MKFSAATEKLLTKEQREQIPHLLERFKLRFPRGRVFEGVKYALHVQFEGDCTTDVYEQIGTKEHFADKLMGKDVTIFFFLPLFE